MVKDWAVIEEQVDARRAKMDRLICQVGWNTPSLYAVEVRDLMEKLRFSGALRAISPSSFAICSIFWLHHKYHR